MPHIHILPNQHDMTVSAYIMRQEQGVWKCLVHFHKKFDTLMQIGGHIELDQTPWQAIVAELREEAGYLPSDLQVLQYTKGSPAVHAAIVHPIPLTMNTHYVGDEHFHSDMCFGFVTQYEPRYAPDDGESTDIRWLDIEHLRENANQGNALKDVADIYEFMLANIDSFTRLEASVFSTDKPLIPSATYKRGRPGR
jgi:8-oxo-dGTP diphosphatase